MRAASCVECRPVLSPRPHCMLHRAPNTSPNEGPGLTQIMHHRPYKVPGLIQAVHYVPRGLDNLIVPIFYVPKEHPVTVTLVANTQSTWFLLSLPAKGSLRVP
eukprot:1142108-Pelagomonas_calceolata.AAC.1